MTPIEFMFRVSLEILAIAAWWPLLKLLDLLEGGKRALHRQPAGIR